MSETASIRDGLLDLYASVDRDVAAAAPVCNLSGRCCRFKEYGHTLFISRPEAGLLLEQPPPTSDVDENTCPYQVHGLCTARERRPLGCRVYFCDPNYVGVGEAISERHVSALKRLHEQTGLSWEYRPLHEFLRERTGLAQTSASP